MDHATFASLKIERVPLRDVAALEPEWRALEAMAPALSFFQSWTWVGCLAEERFPAPVLLRATRNGQVVGLALFNRRGRHLHLTESGDAGLDAPFIEHNAPLVAHPEAAAPLLRAAWALGGARRLVLSGVPPALAEGAGGTVLRCQERLAPRLDLDAARAAHGADWLAGRSPNTRQQIRRSLRAYGMPALCRAETVPEALDWLDALIGLHAASWQARGKPGAFSTPFLRRFHRALVSRALPRDELDLLRITGPERDIGFLYNLRLRGEVSAYQSGLHPGDGAQHRPGLTSHALAIGHALARGDAVYDFLGGDDRYKRSLSSTALPLHWVQRVPRWSAWGIAARLRAAVRRG